jgi:hypothetical protein
MKLHCLTLILVAFVVTGYGQPATEPQYLPISWKVGDKRQVNQENKITSYLGADVLFETSTKSSYEISVLRKMDDEYEVALSKSTFEFINTPLQDNVQFEFLQDFMTVLLQNFYNQNLIFTIDKESGTVTEFSNESEIIEVMNNSTLPLLESVLRKIKPELDDQTLLLAMSEASQIIEGKMEEMLQSMMNSITYLFQVHGLPYALNETLSTTIENYEIDQVNYFGMTYSSELDIHSSLAGNTLKLSCNNRYNENELYEMIVVAQGKQDQVPIDSFDMTEKSNYEIDTNTSWIQRCEIIIDIVLKDVRMVDQTRIELKKI